MTLTARERGIIKATVTPVAEKFSKERERTASLEAEVRELKQELADLRLVVAEQKAFLLATIMNVPQGDANSAPRRLHA